MPDMHGITSRIGRALRPIRSGDKRLAARKLAIEVLPSLDVRSSSFAERGPLPRSAASDAGNDPPSITWQEVPPRTRSLVLICEDPDAPFPEPFVHWIVYNIPADVTAIDQALARGALQGKNSKLGTGFTGAAPPPGHGVHHYHFQLFAIDHVPEIQPGAGRRAVLDVLRNHVVAWGDLVGTFEKN